MNEKPTNFSELNNTLEEWMELGQHPNRKLRNYHGACAVGLDNPVRILNIGAVMRAVGCFGANMVAIAGNKLQKVSTDVKKEFRFTPVLHVDDLRDVIPFGFVPVAVELIDGAVPLHDYQHPAQAFYIFGGENMTLGKRTLSWCRDKIYIPTDGSLNLAMCVNVVLYDRMQKALRSVGNNEIYQKN